jgi:hypothetical protein
MRERRASFKGNADCSVYVAVRAGMLCSCELNQAFVASSVEIMMLHTTWLMEDK